MVNRTELEAMNAGGVPFYAINLAVGISLAIPGFQTDMAKGLLHALPQVHLTYGLLLHVMQPARVFPCSSIPVLACLMCRLCDLQGVLSDLPHYCCMLLLVLGSGARCRLSKSFLQGASSIVGVKSVQEAVKAHAEGADVLLLRRELLEEAEGSGQHGVEQLLEKLRDMTSGDD